ncbi:MAG: aromatic aminobenezylarsenical efflux permease ArsG family transporter [Bacteroidota bacterium]
MERILTEWLASSTLPGVTAMLLGFLVSLSPCPLATNITAMGFIGKDMSSRKRIFYNGLAYSSGTIVSYTLLATILYFGADLTGISGFIQRYGIKIMGPLLILIGFIMLDVVRISFPGFSQLALRFEKAGKKSIFHAFLLGVLLALAFCPNTGALYFGMLIPLTINSQQGLLLPVIFAVSSSVPVVIFAYLIAFSLNGVGTLFGKIRVFEVWVRKAVSILFILAGIFLIYKVYF